MSISLNEPGFADEIGGSYHNIIGYDVLSPNRPYPIGFPGTKYLHVINKGSSTIQVEVQESNNSNQVIIEPWTHLSITTVDPIIQVTLVSLTTQPNWPQFITQPGYDTNIGQYVEVIGSNSMSGLEIRPVEPPHGRFWYPVQHFTIVQNTVYIMPGGFSTRDVYVSLRVKKIGVLIDNDNGSPSAITCYYNMITPGLTYNEGPVISVPPGTTQFLSYDNVLDYWNFGIVTGTVAGNYTITFSAYADFE